jgi:hypothetical protein
MKHIILILVLFGYSNILSAEQRDFFLKKGDCVDINALPFAIVQKLDDHTYELQAEYVNGIRKILITKEAVFTTGGHVTGIKVKLGPSYDLPTNDGFTRNFGSYIECGIVKYPKRVFGPELSFRNRINGD